MAIEPVPQYFEELKANYESFDVQCVNVAVSQAKETRPFWFLSEKQGNQSGRLPSWAKGIGAFDKESVLRNAADIDGAANMLTEMQVHCLPLNDAVGSEIDFDVVVIDTEGYDAEILSQVDLL